MAKILTAPSIANLKPTATRRIIKDGGSQSLYLVVQPSGHKSWLMRFRRPDGKIGKMVLGSVDVTGKEFDGKPVVGMPLTLSAARQLATQVLRDRALGVDPVADHKAAKQRKRTEIKDAGANAFATLVRRYAEEHAKPNTRKWRDTLKHLGLDYPRDGGEAAETKNGLAQRWRGRPVQSIDVNDIYTVLDEARRLGIPGIPARKRKLSEARARDVHTALSSMFGWLHRQRLVNANPCAGVLRPPKAEARERVLTPNEIISFWRACDKISVPFGAVFKLLLLTGARKSEVGGMRWDELRDGEWHLPGSRTKNKKPLVTPLPPLALDIIESVPRIENCPFVFSTTGRTPVSGWSVLKRSLDAAMGDPEPFVIHDLRRTAITGMNELGILPHVIELIVNHVSGHRGGVAGIYNRSELKPERKAALARWAQHIDGLISGPDNVVRLRRR
jgi:integrase